MLAQRVAVAAAGIPIIFGLIWIDGWTYTIAAAIILAVAAAEFVHLRAPWFSIATGVAAAYTIVLALSARTGGAAPVLLLGAAIAVAALPASYYWLRTRNAFAEQAMWAVAAVLYVGLLGSTIVLLRYFDNVTVVNIDILPDGALQTSTSEIDNSRDWVYLALFGTFAVDTAAYFVGRAFGRHRLAPSISPKKTWEGFAGGYAGGFAVVLVLNYLLGLRVGPGAAILLAGTLPVAATTGDLFESWIKRRTGAKDASELIPGHGGVLDRLDSLLFTFPLVYAVARLVA